MNLIKQNEAQYRNIPDPIYSLNDGEGEVVRRTLTTLIQTNMQHLVSRFLKLKYIVLEVLKPKCQPNNV